MGLKWYPHPEDLHCIKGCEVRDTDTSPICPLFLPRPQFSEAQEEKLDYEDVQEL